MTKTIGRRRWPTRGIVRASIMMSVLFVAFLFGACSMYTPLELADASAVANASGNVTALCYGCDGRPGTTPGTTPGGGSGSTSVVPLGAAATFAVLGATTVTNSGTSEITGDAGVSPGTELTGFDMVNNTIVYGVSPVGTVTAGGGIASGTIYAAGDVAAQAHNDAVIAYNDLMSRVPDTTFAGVTQLDGMTLTPGVYSFVPSANLQVNGTLTLDFQGDDNAEFIFQTGTTLVTMAGSNVVAINKSSTTCDGANVFWAVGSGATIDGDQFIGSVIANTLISLTSGASVSGRLISLTGAVTMIENTIAVCEGTGTVPGGGDGGDGDVCDGDGSDNGGWGTNDHSWRSWWNNWFKNNKSDRNNNDNRNNKNNRNKNDNRNTRNDRNNNGNRNNQTDKNNKNHSHDRGRR